MYINISSFFTAINLCATSAMQAIQPMYSQKKRVVHKKRTPNPIRKKATNFSTQATIAARRHCKKKRKRQPNIISENDNSNTALTIWLLFFSTHSKDKLERQKKYQKRKRDILAAALVINNFPKFRE